MINTIFQTVDNNNPNIEIINIGADIITNGGLVAFPTETVYGLGADGLNELATKKIYEAKGRPSDNPLILHISDISELTPLVEEITPLAYKLIQSFWPGALTMIFKKSNIVPDCITGNLDTVAIRIPTNIIARKLIKASKTPIAAPSANSSGKPSPTKALHVKEDLNGKIDMIIDGGSTLFGLESTVVDVTGEIPIILRPGAVTKEMIEKVYGRVLINSAINSNEVPKAPGMKYKHYSPKAKLIIIQGEQQNVINAINEYGNKSIVEGKKVGIMVTEQTKDLYQKDFNIFIVGDRNNPQTIASNLFEIFREFDYLNIDVVYSESFSYDNIGEAIMNRLEKASGYNIIKV